MKTIAIDFDRTICSRKPDPGHRLGPPTEGCKEALELLKGSGYFILIHSCNRPEVIKPWMEYFKIPYDSIWGESPSDCGRKPVADWYVDDRAIRFFNWNTTLSQIL